MHSINRAARAAATLVLLLSALRGAAQPLAAPDPAALRGESAQTRKRLAEIEQKLAAGKHADAADELQRVLDESGDDLVLVDANSARPARWVAHQLIAKLPADALKAYQDRVEQPAKKLLAQAKQARDPRPLYQLLDRYFGSRPADESLLLLGDLLFERGEFREAESVWRRLLSDSGADVAHPDPKTDPALVRARVTLAVLFSGDRARARAELGSFKARHANASGTLAGKTGPLADTLQALLDLPPKLGPEVAANSWATFGGSPDRAGRVPGGVPNYWPSRPAWASPLKSDAPHRTQPAPPPAPAPPTNPPARQPFGHPVIAGGEVFIADPGRVVAFDLQTGTETRSYSPILRPGPNAKNQDGCASLTAANGLLYARFGPPIVRGPEGLTAGKPEDSYLLCLKPQGRELKLLWKLAPPEDAKVPAAWEGAPLVVGNRLWAVYAKFEGGRVIHVAACYDPVEGETEPQRPAWATELADSSQPVSGEGRTRQELLTLAGRHLVFCTNSGAVVAVDAASGRRAWGFRYARSRKAAAHPSGDPAPAVAFGGRVFVAPADGERVYALEAHSGQLVWESGPTEGARVLGVARDRLIVSATGPVRGLRGLALDSGSHRPADGGWVQFNGPGTLSYGHGLVTDDAVLWPSRDGLYFVNPEDGTPLPGRPNPWKAPFPNLLKNYFGHLAYADGVLVVGTATEVWGFQAESPRIVPRPDETPRRRFDALIDRAERRYAAGDRAGGMSDLAEVATSRLPPPLRAWAAARLLQCSLPAAPRDRLPPTVQAALTPDLLTEWLLGPDGTPVTLGAFVERHLGHAPRAGSVPVAASEEPCAAEITPDADFDRTLRLPPGVSPLCALGGGGCPQQVLFAAGSGKLVAVPLDRSAASEYRAPDLFTHAASLRDGFVAAGPNLVALYQRAKDPVWVFRVPVTDRLPPGARPFHLRSDEPVPGPPLSSFLLAGTWLLARVGESHLLALDLQARQVIWVLGATGTRGYEPAAYASAPKFGPHFAVCGRFVVAQLSDGRRWFVRLDTGRVHPQPLLGEGTAKAHWARPPARVGADCLALADGPALVRLVRLGGRVQWAHEADDEGLAGEPAQARAFGETVLIAVRRNYGTDLDCVSAADGKRVWAEGPAFADAFALDLGAADADADHLYVPGANKLHAVALADGKPVWAADLPPAPAGWIVRAGKSCVVAHPVQALPREEPAAAWDRFLRSLTREPFAWRLPGLALTLYDAWGDRVLPLLLFDPETGKQLGRYDIPARGPGAAVRFDAGAAIVATGDRVVWIK